ncbi:MAG: MoxR family ATPase [Geminicoccaceae bacterium]
MLPGTGYDDQIHLVRAADNDAIEAALASRRPLLVRGEPGVGKSQLALAAALDLERAFVRRVVDASTEPRDLLWEEDAVARLGDAQLIGAVGNAGEAAKLRRHLEPAHYVLPGPLWWALNWDRAATKANDSGVAPPPQAAGCDPKNGVVVLIDEIDKADAEVPNGLLEVLGNRSFQPHGLPERIEPGKEWPLIVLTTNEERSLPAAFVRRCVLHVIELPSDEELEPFLIARGQAHFPHTDPAVLAEAARQLVVDRRAARTQRHFPLPGQAEYIDLVRAIITLAPDNVAEQHRLLSRLSKLFLQKHRGLGR